MAKTRRRKPLEPKDLNIIASKTTTSTYVVIEDGEEDVSVKKEQQLEQAKKVFEAIDREVEARSVAMRAICESQISAVVLQLEMQQSKFSDEMLDMPLSEFLSMYCPNTEALKREDGVIELRKKAGVASKAHKEGARLDNLLPTPGNILSSTSVKEMLLKRVETHLAGENANQGEVLNTFSFKSEKSHGKAAGLESPSLQTPGMDWSSGRKAMMTPKTVRLPKPGEALLSLNGSPLGVYGDDGILSVSEVQPTHAKRKLRSSVKIHTQVLFYSRCL